MPTLNAKLTQMQKDLDIAQEALAAGLLEEDLPRFLELPLDEQQDCIDRLNYFNDTWKNKL